MNECKIMLPVVRPFSKKFVVKKRTSFLPWVKKKYKTVYRQYYRLYENYAYYSKRLKRTVAVDLGFEFDGASAPSIAAIFGIRKGGVILGAAVVHDYFYKNRGYVDVNLNIDRKTADLIFRDMLRQSGFSKADYNLAYYGVRTPIAARSWGSR